MAVSLYMSPVEAALVIGVDERHVRALLAAGKIEGEKIGSRWIVLRSSVETYRRHPTKGRPKAASDHDLQQS